MRIRDEKIDWLRGLPAFEAATRRELRALAAAGDLTGAAAGRVLCRADGRALEAYLVVDGEVDVVIDGAVVATLGPGELVGELAVIDGGPRSADVVAATDVTLFAIHAAALRTLIDESHSIRTMLLRQVAARLRRMDLVDLEAVPA